MKHNPYKVLIISCWSMLGVCFILKLLGLNWFETSVDSPTIISIFTYVNTRLWLQQIIACLICLTLVNFVILAVLKQRKYTNFQIIIFIPLIILMSYSAWYSVIANTLLSFLVYLLPIFWLGKYWYRAIFGIILVYTFQFISLIVKNIGGLTLYDTDFMLSCILQIDTLIMVMLYYLYSNRKESL